MHSELIENQNKYIQKAYRKGNVLYSVQQQGDDEGHQLIELSCINVKLESFWAGEWQSTWVLKDGKLSGDLKIRSHYFEMGNMQFNLDQTFDSINVKDIKNAKDIVSAIN